jgi:Na+-driven multidrug efflux pump
MAEQVLRTLMRTTDVIVTGLFSPAAVAAVGLADLYARLPLRIGLGLGGGAIALSSQDTGSGATANRDEAITQAILIGAVSGIPFVAFGFLLGEFAIEVLGATSEVARMGGLYLAIIFATSPARHVGLIAARSLQGTGDTRTPMYVNVVSNLLNIAATVAEFPFNALLLVFRTEVNAAYQIGRRMYQQVTGPLSRGYHVAASVVVGQASATASPGRHGSTAGRPPRSGS